MRNPLSAETAERGGIIMFIRLFEFIFDSIFLIGPFIMLWLIFRDSKPSEPVDMSKYYYDPIRDAYNEIDEL